MQRPWVQPAEVKEYSESAKVSARSDVRLAYDIARAERYVIYHTCLLYTSDAADE